MATSTGSTFDALLFTFSSAFTGPSFANFVTLVAGWIRCTGRHTITGAIRYGMGASRGKHFSTLYRFLSRAVWDPDDLGHGLLRRLLPLAGSGGIHLIVDDTLCRHSGPHFWGAGMHHDPLASTYGRGAARWIAWACGHNWVVLALWIPLPWGRGLAIPILWRLYRSKKLTPGAQYRKRTELAAELVRIVAGWLPAGRKAILLADTEYACRTVLRALPPRVDFVGPLPMNAALFDLPAAQPPRGRRRRKGTRFPTPRQIAADPGTRWRTLRVPIYGRDVSLKIKTFDALWWNSCGERLVTVVLTRDPAGFLQDRAYFCTDTSMGIDQILVAFSHRWALEVAFRDTKQRLGLEEPQNGWGRRAQGARRRRKRPGAQPRENQGRRAVQRTVPLIFCTYGLVVAWYLQHGNIAQDVQRVRDRSPWYRHKLTPSFADMLEAVRRELWTSQLQAYPALHRVRGKLAQILPEWLLAAG